MVPVWLGGLGQKKGSTQSMLEDSGRSGTSLVTLDKADSRF